MKIFLFYFKVLKKLVDFSVQKRIAWHPKCVLLQSNLEIWVEMVKSLVTHTLMIALSTKLYRHNTSVEMYCPVGKGPFLSEHECVNLSIRYAHILLASRRSLQTFQGSRDFQLNK
ncbi:hypothetical protein NPIL_161871 [Nephila pilipes]|uniref:Uncharacterized protein n=1 Tax=Nephila pilipes TaxID=299642 RepID=A0A8X6N1B5_NEPPI|nr:hypothetical protein NPIL_161871 [Nephila pilipes]